MKSLGTQINQFFNKTPLLKKFKNFCVATDKSLDKEIPLLLLLLLIVILRIPNFFEPYWYGDEAIYLTIGNALREGSALYADIVDHKTPIIYYLAMVPTQFWFRILLLVWMLITTAAFYHFALQLFKKSWLATTSSLIFIILTTMPWLEGNIPNGELFVMGFILVGGTILIHTKFIKLFLGNTQLKSKSESISVQTRVSRLLEKTNDWILYILVGILFGLAILTKVPALMDVIAFLSIAGFTLTNRVNFLHFFTKEYVSQIQLTILRSLVIFTSVMLTIGASVLYYLMRGTLDAYLQFGLLYNFHYVQTWSLGFNKVWLETAYTLPGKMGIALFFLLLIMILRDWFKPRIQFIAAWFTLALFASLLSNRPYPHYFLQVVPPLALLVVELLSYVTSLIKLAAQKSKTFLSSQQIAAATVGITLIGLFIGVLFTLNVGFYPTQKYYKRSYDYLSGSMSQAEYYQAFNDRMRDNYHAAEIINQTSDPYLFIWGTNPELYALSKKIPVGKFTVSFHIKDLKLYDETMQAVLENKPPFIIVMRNEDTELPGLRDLLLDEYIMNNNFHYFELWKKQVAQ